MLINLLEILDNVSSSKEKEYNKYLQSIKQKSIDDKFTQSSFEFTSPIKVIFVRSINPLIFSENYDSLDGFSLTATEKKIIDAYLLILEKKDGFYDGDHFLLKNILFDTEKNELYLEAVKVKYSFLAAIQKTPPLFDHDSRLYQLPFYKTGVIAPFITKDQYTVLMQRNDLYGLLSAASGFLEPIEVAQDKLINFESEDLVTKTAKKEAIEEFLGNSSGKSRLKMEVPHISSLSLRKSKHTPLNTIEFIAPIKLPCDESALNYILKTNKATDRREHTEIFEFISLDPEKRKAALDFLRLKKPGSMLYDPILLATARLANLNFDPYYFLPGSRTCALPVRTFIPEPDRRPLLFTKQEREQKINRALSNDEPRIEIPKSGRNSNRT